MRVKILTDSTCDLRKEDLERLDVGVIPLFVNCNGQIYEDGKGIDIEGLFGFVKENKKLPKTSCRSPLEMQEFFQKYLDEGYDQIFYTGIGGSLSGNYNSGMIAAREIGGNKCVVVDSKNLSTGIGLLVLKACKYRDLGLNAQEIGKKIEFLVPKVRSQFVIDTLDYLHKGGRCSGMTKIFGTLLSIKPNIKVINGKLEVARKPRGMKNGLKLMLEDLKEALDANRLDLDCIMVTHSIAPIDAKLLKIKLADMGLKDKVMETIAGCTIGTHCGPGTIGILFIEK